MRLDGIDHITGITADGQRCLDFYAGILGLAFVGRDEDFEAPDSHLIRLGDRAGHSGGILTFIEAPGIARGRAGNGAAHLLRWTVGVPAALDYWAERFSDAGIQAELLDRGGGDRRLRFTDPEGLGHELTVEPAARTTGLALGSSAIPRQHAILRLAGVRAYGRSRVPSADILAGRLGFRVTGADSYAVGDGEHGSEFAFDPPPLDRGRLGAGTIHHVAWAADGSLAAWRQRVVGMGCVATPAIDRGRWHSIYFREPSGVMFEIAAAAPVGDGDAVEAGPKERRLSPRVDPRVRVAVHG
ncbi:MAG TPA: VOC family protein [Solirubrobacterales bacterium]